MQSIKIIHPANFEILQEIINRQKLNLIIDKMDGGIRGPIVRIIGLNLEIMEIKDVCKSKGIGFEDEL